MSRELKLGKLPNQDELRDKSLDEARRLSKTREEILSLSIELSDSLNSLLADADDEPGEMAFSLNPRLPKTSMASLSSGVSQEEDGSGISPAPYLQLSIHLPKETICIRAFEDVVEIGLEEEDDFNEHAGLELNGNRDGFVPGEIEYAYNFLTFSRVSAISSVLADVDRKGIGIFEALYELQEYEANLPPKI